MKRLLGVSATCALLAFAGCGGVSELEQDEVEIAQAGTDTVVAASKSGKLGSGDEKKVEALLILCHEKPLAEFEGQSMREIVRGLAPKLKQADKELSERVKTVAAHGCDGQR